MFRDFEIVHSYSRAEAIADQALYDLSARFPEQTRQLFKYNVCCTAAVWAIIEQGAAAGNGNSEAGIVWDLLWMSQKGVVQEIDATQRLFNCIITGAGGNRFARNQTYTFRAVCGPGDDCEPVITILLPGED